MVGNSDVYALLEETYNQSETKKKESQKLQEGRLSPHDDYSPRPPHSSTVTDRKPSREYDGEESSGSRHRHRHRDGDRRTSRDGSGSNKRDRSIRDDGDGEDDDRRSSGRHHRHHSSKSRDDRSRERRHHRRDKYENGSSSRHHRDQDDDDAYESKRSRRDEDEVDPEPRNVEPPAPMREFSPPLTEAERDQRTVFVQQLAARLRTRELIEFFSQAGAVRDAQIVKDRISSRSKGVGYVEFRSPDSMAAALNMTGQKLLGIPVIVQLTESEKNRQAKEASSGISGRGSGESNSVNRLYVGNVHFSLTEDDIKNIFEPFGELEFVQMQKDNDSNRSRGYGFVQFVESSAAKEALEKMNGFELAGRPIRVGLGNEKIATETTSSMLSRQTGFEGSAFDDRRQRQSGGSERLGSGRGGASSSLRASNLDDSDIAGVSFHNISRESLMKKLARDDTPTETIAPKIPDNAPPLASRCVLLKNMFDPADETGENWVKELEQDVKAECEEKYGKVLHIHVEEQSKGEIYVKFDSVAAGERAMQSLNGRWFGGRVVSASPVIDAVYASRFPRSRAL